jgi:hypothetical protein
MYLLSLTLCHFHLFFLPGGNSPQASTIPMPFVSPSRLCQRPRLPRMQGSGDKSSLAQRARLRSSAVCFAAVAVALERTNRFFSVPFSRFAALALHERPFTQLSICLRSKSTFCRLLTVIHFCRFCSIVFAQAGVPLGRAQSQSAAASASSPVSLSNPTPRTGSLGNLAAAAAAREPYHRDNGNNVTFEDKSGVCAFPMADCCSDAF